MAQVHGSRLSSRKDRINRVQAELSVDIHCVADRGTDPDGRNARLLLNHLLSLRYYRCVRMPPNYSSIFSIILSIVSELCYFLC